MNKGDKKYVLDKIMKNGLEVQGKWFVKDWPEPYLPTYAPSTYVDLMDRLDSQKFEYEGRACTAESWLEASGRIYTTLIFADGNSLNFQSQNQKKRWSLKSDGKSLEGFDVSASQLRVALALRGKLLPFSESPWDSLVPKVKHSELDWLSEGVKRKVVKAYALMAVKKIEKFDIKKKWDDIVNKPPKKNLQGLKGVIKVALFDAYPELKEPLPTIARTPDGYEITKIIEEQFLRVRCRPLDVDTKYKMPKYGKADENNILEAMEAWILREALIKIPDGAPVLTCHDEVVTLPECLPTIRATWEASLRELAALALNRTSDF